jgi:hypothetical protein
MAAHFGPWSDLRAFQEHVLGGTPAEPAPKANGWGLAAEPCPPGFFIDELAVPIDRFRVPPKELEDALPQQLLMLQMAAAALDDAVRGRFEPPADGDPTTAVFVGLGLDPNTTNYHLRWAAIAQETGDGRQETGDRRRETGRRETVPGAVAGPGRPLSTRV